MITAWDTAAWVGLRDRRLYVATNQCVCPSPLQTLRYSFNGTMERLVRKVEQGRCPGYDFSDRAIKYDIAATLASRVRRGRPKGFVTS